MTRQEAERVILYEQRLLGYKVIFHNRWDQKLALSFLEDRRAFEEWLTTRNKKDRPKANKPAWLVELYLLHLVATAPTGDYEDYLRRQLRLAVFRKELLQEELRRCKLKNAKKTQVRRDAV